MLFSFIFMILMILMIFMITFKSFKKLSARVVHGTADDGIIGSHR